MWSSGRVYGPKTGVIHLRTCGQVEVDHWLGGCGQVPCEHGCVAMWTGTCGSLDVRYMWTCDHVDVVCRRWPAKATDNDDGTSISTHGELPGNNSHVHS